MHTDDSIRAVLTCFDCADVISGLGPGLFGRFGVTQGTIYCGLVGAASRQECAWAYVLIYMVKSGGGVGSIGREYASLSQIARFGQ